VGDIDRRGGLPDAAFLVCQCYRLSQQPPIPRDHG
jgi:hypothetical protein